MVSIYLVKFGIAKIQLYRHGSLSLICRLHIERRTLAMLENRLFPVETRRLFLVLEGKTSFGNTHEDFLPEANTA